MWGERLQWWLHPLHVTQQYHLTSMTTWLSSKGNPLCNLLPHVPRGHLPAVNSRPHPGIAPQSLHFSSQPPCIPEDLHSCLGYIWMCRGSSVWFSLHSDCHRSIAALSNSLKCFPASQTMPQMWWSDPCFSSLTLQVQVQPCLLSSFSLPSFTLPSFVWIYTFLSRDQGLLPALSWCSERSSESEDVFLKHLWRCTPCLLLLCHLVFPPP